MIVTFGEAMIRLAPPQFRRFEQARSFDVEVGGAELNVAVGLAQLGRESAWVSALPDQALGRLVLNRARECGVNVDQVALLPEGRCGLYFLESGAAPRPSAIIYDRAHSAMCKVIPGSTSFWGGWKSGTFNWKAIFEGEKWFHVTGITPALNTRCAEVVQEAVHLAREAGLRVSLDVNYRSQLWSTGDAGRVLSGLLKSVDLLFATAHDASQLFGIDGDDFGTAARRLAEKFGIRHLASVVREAQLVWRNRFGGVGYANGQVITTPTYEVEIVDRLGAGDAFAAGVIHGLLDDDFEKGLEMGAAMGALQHTVPGDMPNMTWSDIVAVMIGQGLRIKR